MTITPDTWYWVNDNCKGQIQALVALRNYVESSNGLVAYKAMSHLMRHGMGDATFRASCPDYYLEEYMFFWKFLEQLGDDSLQDFPDEMDGGAPEMGDN